METTTLQSPEIAAAAGTMWTIDPDHSTIGFAVRHMKVATVHGRFDAFKGTITFNRERPDEAAVMVVIDTASINTGVRARDTHLRSADFFDVEHYPVATFHGASVAADGSRFEITGELTIKDITRPVTLTAETYGSGMNPSGVEVIGFRAKGELNRKDFGLNWNQALESGGLLIGDEIKLSFEIEAGRAEQ